MTVAMSDPTNIRAMDEINFICGYQVEPVVASEYAIKESIDKYYGSTQALELKQAMQAAIAERDGDTDIEDLEVLEESTDVDLAALERQTEDAPVVKLVNKVLYDALNEGASDIHVDFTKKNFVFDTELTAFYM